MRRIWVSLLVAAFVDLPPAPAAADDTTPIPPGCPRQFDAGLSRALRAETARLRASGYAPSDTTYVGFNPAYAGSNYWSIGIGNRRPRGVTGPGKGDVVPVPDQDTGYWDWEHPVHGDSLQGWWPVRHRAKNAPTPEMMTAYYRILTILSGNVNTYALIGPYSDRSADDTEFIRLFVTGATANAHRGLWCGGVGFVEDLDANGNTTMMNLLGVSLRHSGYIVHSGNSRTCVDLIPTAAITTNGDIYGIRNSCRGSLDVLEASGGAEPASYYDPVGASPLNAPYVAGVFRDADPNANPARHYQSLVDGFTLESLKSRLCDTGSGRLAYLWNVFNNVFGKICSVAGAPPVTLDVPGNADGGAFVNLAGLGNNPLRAGSAVIHLSLAQADRVTVKIYDVSGRLVRTLADGQLFKAGRVDPALTWDGLDDAGRGVARGAHFVSVRYERSRFETAKKMIVLQ